MWAVIVILAAVSILVGLGIWSRQRTERQIKQSIESRGGVVRKIKPTIQHRGEFSVLFESPRGDLRHAIVRVHGGSAETTDNQPYHRFLRPPKEGSGVSIDRLAWIGKLQQLPGYAQYVEIIRQLIARPYDLKIAADENRYAAILQCVEMQSMAGGDTEPGTIELNVNGRPAKLTWNVDANTQELILHCEPI